MDQNDVILKIDSRVNQGATVILHPVRNPSLYGVASINNKNKVSFKIYPNPVQNVLKVELKQIELPCTITLKDLQGREIQSTITNSHKMELDLSSFERGIYVIGIANNNFSRELKVVRE